MTEAVCPRDGQHLEHVIGSYETRLPNRERVHLEDVRGVHCPECGETWYPGEEIRTEALKAWAHLNDIYEEEVPILMLLGAPSPSENESGHIRSRTIFHKMLFDSWSKLGFTTDLYGRFNPAPNGPMYHDFDNYEWHLGLRGYMDVEEGHPPFTSHDYFATDEGRRIGNELLHIAPRSWKEVINQTKEAFFHENATDVADHFHDEFPEWKADRDEDDES